jgi:hypothetical protein
MVITPDPQVSPVDPLVLVRPTTLLRVPDDSSVESNDDDEMVALLPIVLLGPRRLGRVGSLRALTPVKC